MLLEELKSEFILDCQIRNLSKRTVETYELNINLFLRWLEKEMKVNELPPLNKNHFKMYVVHLQREQYQASYINLLMKCLKSFFNYLVEEEYVSVNYPKQIKVLKEEQKVIDTF
ncbi:phage integrase N-terminal SAM-like domain-containing protein [Vagococcus fluvialis]